MNLKREPTAIMVTIAALLSSITKLLVLLNVVQWDAAQLAAIDLVIGNALLVIGGLFLRERVTPVATPSLEAGTELTVTSKAGAETKTVTV